MKLLFTIILTSCFALSFGQSSIDVLKDVVEDYPDSVRSIAFENMKKVDNVDQKAAYQHLIALSYQANLDWNTAINHLKIEDSLFRLGSPKIEDQIQNRHELAKSYYQKGALVTSDSLLQETLGLASLSEDHSLSCEVLLDAGWIARERGRHAEALDHYFKAKQIAQTNNDSLLLGECYSKIAVVYHVKYEFETAKKNYDLALAIFKSLDKKLKVGRLYNNYGLLYQ